jgi:hypothetical protein
MIGYLHMEFSHVTVMKEHGIHAVTFYRPLALWFTYTALRAASAAVCKDHLTHAVWAIRHIGPGLTFAMGRVLVLVLGALLHFSTLVDMSKHENKMSWFYACCYMASIFCVGGCEWTVYSAFRSSTTMQQQQNQQQQQYHNQQQKQQ